MSSNPSSSVVDSNPESFGESFKREQRVLNSRNSGVIKSIAGFFRLPRWDEILIPSSLIDFLAILMSSSISYNLSMIGL